MAKKLRRKDLKQPDEFVTLTHRALEYGRQNERHVVFGTLGVIVLVALALGVRTYRQWQTQSAREAFADAYGRFAAGELERAAEAFQHVQASWSSTPSSELAAIYAGNALAELGRLEEAHAAFADVAETNEPSLRQIALYNLGVLGRKGGSPGAEARQQLQLASEIEGPLRGAAWLAARPTGGDAGEPMPDGVSQDVRDYLNAKRGS